MAIFKRASSQALVLGALLLAGCAEGGDNILTGSLAGTNAKADPACVTLASRIETLRKEGIADKIEKAAARRYKLTKSDLAKADQLTKTSAELQERCSSVPPRTNTADATPPAADKKAKTPAARKPAPKAPAPAPAKTEQ